MNQPPENDSKINIDPIFDQQVQKLHRLTVYTRWLVVVILWITVGLLSLWNLRDPISLLRDNFTWAALRYGLVYNRLPTLGITLCIGMTTAVLVWQSRNIIWGLPAKELQRLQQQVLHIRQQGKTHPLWKFLEKSE